MQVFRSANAKNGRKVFHSNCSTAYIFSYFLIYWIVSLPKFDWIEFQRIDIIYTLLPVDFQMRLHSFTPFHDLYEFCPINKFAQLVKNSLYIKFKGHINFYCLSGLFLQLFKSIKLNHSVGYQNSQRESHCNCITS